MGSYGSYSLLRLRDHFNKCCCKMANFYNILKTKLKKKGKKTEEIAQIKGLEVNHLSGP